MMTKSKEMQFTRAMLLYLKSAIRSTGGGRDGLISIATMLWSDDMMIETNAGGSSAWTSLKIANV